MITTCNNCGGLIATFYEGMIGGRICKCQSDTNSGDEKVKSSIEKSSKFEITNDSLTMQCADCSDNKLGSHLNFKIEDAHLLIWCEKHNVSIGKIDLSVFTDSNAEIARLKQELETVKALKNLKHDGRINISRKRSK